MRALIHLQLWRIKNGIRRSFNSPVRTLMSVFVFSYLLVMLAFFFKGSAAASRFAFRLDTIDPRMPGAVLTLLHVLLAVYVLPPPRFVFSIFTEVDVANIYPAPMQRWRPFAFFFFLRSILSPLVFFALVAMYGSRLIRHLAPGIVQAGGDSYSVLWTTFYILLVVAAITGLLLWRLIADIRREFGLMPRNAFRNAAILGGGSLLVGMIYHCVAAMSDGMHPLVGLVTFSESQPFALVLAPFRFFQEILSQRVDVASMHFWGLLIFWIALPVTGYYVLRSHQQWLYEYAGRLAAARARQVARATDPVEQMKEKIAGKEKSFHTPALFRMLHPRGAGAILWRDAIIAWRSYGILIFGMSGALLVLVVGAYSAVSWFHLPVKVSSVVVFSALAVFSVLLPLSMVSILSFAEILRRVEVQKPLPIGAMQTIAMHILQWTMLASAVPLLPFLAGAALFNEHWITFLGLLLCGCSFMHTVTSVNFWMALQNPDMQDPLQRFHVSFFGILLELAASLPGVLVLASGRLLDFPFAFLLLPVMLVNGGMAYLFHQLSRRKYFVFVPTM